MSTIAGSGASVMSDSREAALDAVRAAVGRLQGRKPLVGFLFASPKYSLSVALDAAQEAAHGAELIACTTAGEITERGLTRGGMAALVLASDSLAYDLAVVSGVRADPIAAAHAACAGFVRTSERSLEKGLPYSTSVILVDGLCGAGENLVNETLRITRPMHQVVGGAAGDDGAFRVTHVGGGKTVRTDAAALLHVFGDRPWGVGVDHGLTPRTEPMTVTRARGSVIQEIDHAPAFEAYKTFARSRGIELTPSNAPKFMMANEIGVYFLGEIRKARAPLSVGVDGSIACAAEVPEGAKICILAGEPSSMVAAAKHASEEALGNIRGASPAGVLVFDCVGRGMILEAGFRKEIEAIKSVFPGVPIAGFLTYGEIARFKGRLDGWHNTTAVIVVIPG